MDINIVPVPKHGYFSEIGPQPLLYSFEDKFTSETSLGPDRQFISNIEERKEEDSCPGGSRSKHVFFMVRDDSDPLTTIYRESYSRFIVENGQKVEKPANKWLIILKDYVPKGCEVAHYLDILKQVVGSDADEVYDGAVSYNAFHAILTDEEHDKFRDLERVSKLVQDNDYIERY